MFKKSLILLSITALCTLFVYGNSQNQVYACLHSHFSPICQKNVGTVSPPPPGAWKSWTWSNIHAGDCTLYQGTLTLHPDGTGSWKASAFTRPGHTSDSYGVWITLSTGEVLPGMWSLTLPDTTGPLVGGGVGNLGYNFNGNQPWSGKGWDSLGTLPWQAVVEK